jgi:hypothetical protein
MCAILASCQITNISNHGLIVIGIAFLLLSLLLGVFSLAENKEKA